MAQNDIVRNPRAAGASEPKSPDSTHSWLCWARSWLFVTVKASKEAPHDFGKFCCQPFRWSTLVNHIRKKCHILQHVWFLVLFTQTCPTASNEIYWNIIEAHLHKHKYHKHWGKKFGLVHHGMSCHVMVKQQQPEQSWSKKLQTSQPRKVVNAP